MTRIVRWNPVVRRPVDLFNEFERMFDRPTAPYRTEENWGLALDVIENEDGYTVMASVPGINPDDLTIKGEVENNEEINQEQYHLRERRYGSFSRSVKFPVLVNSESVEASYAQGVLSLNIPKAEEVKPKRIAIKAS